MVVVVWFAKMRFPLFSCLPLVSCCLKMLNWFYIALKFLLYIYISYERVMGCRMRLLNYLRNTSFSINHTELDN